MSINNVSLYFNELIKHKIIIDNYYFLLRKKKVKVYTVHRKI